ncbi:amino acid adenylation domain-containing protein [Kribbella sp. NPDC005582]|uniref:amino acid adenylation domain-containing protein n=1 Tax=Kribbella sp. NPDC005582 TaxID=3156893 RepID=UPI0033BF9E5C
MSFVPGAKDPAGAASLAHLLTKALDVASDELAVTDAYGSLTYAQLHAHASGLAELLLDDHATSQAPVAVALPLSRWVPVGFVAVLASGRAYVPLDVRLPEERRKRIIEDAGCSHVMELGINGAPVLHALSDGRRVGASVTGSHARSWVEAPADHPAYIMYTSGSTGTPKGVVVSRAALAYSTATRVAFYRDDQPERPVLMLCSSPSFDTSVAGIYWALATGGHLVVPSPIPGHAASTVRACAEYGVTATLVLPRVAELLVDRAGDNELKSLRSLIVCGEEFPAALLTKLAKRLPDATIYNEYGPTEGTVWCLAHRCSGIESPVPIGTPIPGTEAVIVDAAGRSLDGDSEGELWISGPGLSSGYLGRSSDEGFPSVDGRRYYATGDRVARRDGLFHYRGRVDFQLKVGGMRLEPEEIERALRNAVGGLDTAVGVAPSDAGPVLVAFVVSGVEVDVRQIRQQLLATLPAVAIPKHLVTLDTLPVGARGKLDRTALNAMAAHQLAVAH